MIIQNIYGIRLLKCKKEKGKYNLRRANLRKADLSGADLREANLRGADLSGADLYEANLRGANLSEANLTIAHLYEANLSGANLWKADLSGADLREANLRVADLSGADLYEANLRGANLSEANLRGAKGLIKEIDWLDANLEKTEEGYICYKSFGEYHNPPASWVIEENFIIEEDTLEKDRIILCASGINIATKEWCNKNCSKQVWKCLLKFEWLNDICVPHGTDGKFRCSKLLILGKLE